MAKKSSDDVVLDLIKKVKDKKAEIKGLTKPNWLTNCTLGYSTDSVADRTMLQTAKPEKLVELYIFLLAKERDWEQANTDLGLALPPIWQNYKIADWKSDLRTRSSQLSIDKKKKELESMESRLDKLISPELRREMELEAIQKELGD